MVEIKNLTKVYGNHRAVDDLTITVEEGRIYGFLGPNGAGKSTTMNIMTGCLAATSGEVKINGFDILTQPMEAKKCIGYLPEQPPLYMDMTPREYLTFVCGLKGIKGKMVKEEVLRVAQMTQIEDHLDRLIKHLSKGYKQRVGIAQAVLGDPKLVILDEPTVGLDPKQITEIRELIRELGRNRTVILSSHILTEVNTVCDKIMIIRKGKLVACDTPDNLTRTMLGEAALTLTVDPCGKKLSALSQLEGVLSFEQNPSEHDEGCVELTIHHSPEVDIRRDVFKAVSDLGCVILSMNEVRHTLEDIFLELTSTDEPAPEAEESVDVAPAEENA